MASVPAWKDLPRSVCLRGRAVGRHVYEWWTRIVGYKWGRDRLNAARRSKSHIAALSEGGKLISSAHGPHSVQSISRFTVVEAAMNNNKSRVMQVVLIAAATIVTQGVSLGRSQTPNPLPADHPEVTVHGRKFTPRIILARNMGTPE